ncbi:hypothetical protein B0J11DRAFT_299008 [Dendryphion nanum]|uniref:Uncharacterized protein n=1 Tax=Dendryphion nanum TaxID=256645 RepID=A0A9P9DSX7_9PLEO|nr:hypothetical protein B0J11DRAFT_299008 [Dendryphion nanum]
MATAEPASRPHDRHSHKRPFGWIKRLANLKSSSDSPNTSGKKNQGASQSKSKKAAIKNNPYQQSARLNENTTNNNGNPGHLSFSTPGSPHSRESFTSVEDAASRHEPLYKSNKSTAPTVATNVETVHSGRSKATGNTLGGGNSTFSSPNHSERSLTTTLTTIQSSAPSNVLGQHTHNAPATNAPPVHFSHQFPTSPPASAIPPHVALQNPQTYQAATANNILTDNASILTLASSSKRRRRNSLDTNASVRALAPSSVWGGSRESLPLSVLSGNPDAIYSPQNRPNVAAGFANAERASVYSSSGVVAPIHGSERNSYYANKQNTDGVSVRSGLLGHGRTDSINGSIHATPSSPLASPRDVSGPGLLSRRSSDWKDAGEAHGIGEERDFSASPVVERDEKEKGKGRAHP